MVDGTIERVAFVQNLWNGVLETVRQPLHLRGKVLGSDTQKTLRTDNRAVEIACDLAVKNPGQGDADRPCLLPLQIEITRTRAADGEHGVLEGLAAILRVKAAVPPVELLERCKVAAFGLRSLGDGDKVELVEQELRLLVGSKARVALDREAKKIRVPCTVFPIKRQEDAGRAGTSFNRDFRHLKKSLVRSRSENLSKLQSRPMDSVAHRLHTEATATKRESDASCRPCDSAF